MYKLKYPVAFHSVDMAITRVKDGKIQVLLAQKLKDENNSWWRFPGGFIDPWDSCAEEAALREAMEETGMNFLNDAAFAEYFKSKAGLTKKTSSLIEELAEENEISESIKKIHAVHTPESLKEFLSPVNGNIRYIGTTRIDDARYRDSDHKIITTFYELTPIEGSDKDGEGPFDDIARTKWFDMVDLAMDSSFVHPAHRELLQMFLDRHYSDFHVKVNNIKNKATKIKEDVADMFKDIKTLF